MARFLGSRLGFSQSGGQSQYSLQLEEPYGGALGLVTDLPARLSSAYAE